jgi:hypothetical protein
MGIPLRTGDGALLRANRKNTSLLKGISSTSFPICKRESVSQLAFLRGGPESAHE